MRKSIIITTLLLCCYSSIHCQESPKRVTPSIGVGYRCAVMPDYFLDKIVRGDILDVNFNLDIATQRGWGMIGLGTTLQFPNRVISLPVIPYFYFGYRAPVSKRIDLSLAIMVHAINLGIQPAMLYHLNDHWLMKFCVDIHKDDMEVEGLLLSMGLGLHYRF